MLTAKGDITDKVNGLDIGADDYLTKPFEIEKKLARMRVILRRKSQTANQSKIIQVADLKLDLEKKQVSRNKETGGVGLGLAIAKSIANINGAEIKLESEPKKGSNFILIFKETDFN